jgi:adenylate cyclase class 2
MIEVETKVRVENIFELRKKVKSIAKFVSREKKVDDYYTLERGNKYPRKSLRIRKKGNKYEINFKQRKSYLKGIHAKKESEFVVSDLNNFLGLIEDFGFRKWLRKEKHCEIYEIKKNFHIELNKVKGLGWFMEIEYLTDLKRVKKARNEILKVMKKLAVEKKDIVKEGYTKQLWDLKKN